MLLSSDQPVVVVALPPPGVVKQQHHELKNGVVEDAGDEVEDWKMMRWKTCLEITELRWQPSTLKMMWKN